MEKTADRLRNARERAGYLTPDEFATVAQLDAEIYRSYETGFRDVPPTTGHRIAQLLNVDWLHLLYGRHLVHASVDAGWQGGAIVPRALAPQPRNTVYVGTAPTPPGPPLLPEATPAAVALGLATPYLSNPLRARSPSRAPAAPEPARAANAVLVVPELDPVLAGGAGIERASPVPIQEWRLPRDVTFGDKSGASNLKMISVVGDDMAPTLREGDRVMVDTADTQPSPAGIFLLWDGMALIVRRIEIVPDREPILLRIAADNPRIEPIARRQAETVIQGRVVGKWSAV